jgi:hypothetical protein
LARTNDPYLQVAAISHAAAKIQPNSVSGILEAFSLESDSAQERRHDQRQPEQGSDAELRAGHGQPDPI